MPHSTIDRRTAFAVGARLAVAAGLTRTIPTIHLPRLPRFVAPLAIPPILRSVRSDEDADYYEIDQLAGEQEILPGKRTAIWGYAGQSPGPTIIARSGRAVVVRHTNRLNAPTVVHLHGGRTESDSDGFPTDFVMPGTSRNYRYANRQPAATLWYHDHAMDHTGRNLYMGLAGFYFLHDDEEDALHLPSGEYDIPLMIQNRSVDDSGALRYDTDRFLGAQGDIVLVNGIAWPRLDVAARKYRFRILNASNATPYDLALSDGRPLVQIATDGGLLPAPVECSHIPLAMAERVEIVIDFARYPLGANVVLRNLADDGDRSEILRFDVTHAEHDDSELPATLRPFSRIAATSAVLTRQFVVQGGPSSFPPVAHWTINGKDFDPGHSIASPRLGDVELWNIENHKRFGFLGRLHPIHVHLVHFQILERNGRPPLVHEHGWKDTIALEKGEEARIIMRFDGYRGRYLIHCHNLEHEDHSMMARFDVV